MDINSIPKWQLYGSALYWDETTKEGLNHVTNTLQSGTRRKLIENYELPIGEVYRNWIAKLVK